MNTQRIIYRDAREKAKIACHWCDELVALRGFGPLKNIYKGQTLIGRIRVNDLRQFDNQAIANRQPFNDYNPGRILQWEGAKQ